MSPDIDENLCKLLGIDIEALAWDIIKDDYTTQIIKQRQINDAITNIDKKL